MNKSQLLEKIAEVKENIRNLKFDSSPMISDAEIRKMIKIENRYLVTLEKQLVESLTA